MSGSDDKTLRIWDAVSGTHLNTLKGHSDCVHSVAFHPDGTCIVSGSKDTTLQLWDAVSGVHLNMFKRHSRLVCSIAFSPDGTHILSGSDDKTVQLWNALSGAHLSTLHGNSDWVHSVAFSPDGTHIMSESGDKVVILWDAVSGKTIDTFRNTHPVNSPSHWLQMAHKIQMSSQCSMDADGWIFLAGQKRWLCWIPVLCRPYNVGDWLSSSGNHVAFGTKDHCVIILELPGWSLLSTMRVCT